MSRRQYLIRRTSYSTTMESSQASRQESYFWRQEQKETHSDYIYIPNWFRNQSNNIIVKVYIVGGMGGSKQQSNQIKLLLVWWMDGTITDNTSDAQAPLLVLLQGLWGV